jgi:hypothetical protein
MIGHFGRLLLMLLTLGLLAAPAMAQPAVSSSDIARLQETVDQIERDLETLRARDTAAARRLDTEVAELKDEVAYLRVLQRKERSVPRAEYADLRDRLDRLRTRASGAPAQTTTQGTTQTGTQPGARTTRDREVPVGTELDIRLQTLINSGTAKVEDRFEATTLVDLLQDNEVLVPAGAVVRGVVTAVQPAGRLERKASLSLRFDQITFGGRTYPLRATLTHAVEGEGIRGEAGRVGTGAAVGGVIGGILGGVRGALAGILIGGGGTVIATEGEDVELKPGTVLRMRFDSPLAVAQ